MAVPTQSDTRWYRNGYVWLVIALPAITVIGGFVTLFLAGGPPSLVVDDYARVQLIVARDYARDSEAGRRGLTAVVWFPLDGGIAVRATAAAETMQPERLILRFMHPTNPARDREIVLERVNDYWYAPGSRPAGRYYVELADETGAWRLVAELSGAATDLSLRPGDTRPTGAAAR